MTDKKELKEEKVLKEEELENVGGGYVFYDRYGSGKWQIISDRTGSVKNDGFLSKKAAQEWAEKTGYGTDEISWEEEIYKVVTSIRADSMQNKISIESPLGKALLNKHINEIVKVVLENGSSYELKIIEIDKTTDAEDDNIKAF